MENAKKNTIKIVLIGGENSGKTKFCEYLGNKKQAIDFSNYVPSISAQFLSKGIIYKNIFYRLEVWDIAGKEKFDQIAKIFYKNADLVFIFFIYNSKNSFKRANTIFQLAQINTKPDVIFALIGNKYDEDKNCLKEEDNILHEEEILEFVEKNNLIFGHLSIKEKYSNGFNEIFMKVMNEYTKKKKNK